jgi:SAM-dependent methyltransferase
MEEHLKDINGRAFYINLIDPNLTFNNIEITLAHLFRKKMKVLGNRNYSDCLYQYLKKKNYIKQDIIEIGCGLGDLALNLLKTGENVKHDINNYVMYDISPSLMDVERERLGDIITEYVLDDCLELSEHFADFNGMILSNAMLADLRSIYLSPEDSLEDYDVYDLDLLDFTKQWNNISKDGWYFHIGTVLFLRQISMTLAYGGTAVISEYTATKLNQPSLFGNHYECGIDFPQISAYAERLGFEVEIVDIEKILDISCNQQFLSVDIFTIQDKLAKKVPMSVKLWKAKNQLPVLAYTRNSLKSTLVSDYMGFSTSEANTLIEALDGIFYSIHDPRFDHKNPTTWGYKCMLLRKIEPKNWEEISRQVAIPIFADVYSESEDEALKRWENATYNIKMGIGLELILDGILIAIIYDALKKYGPKVWKYCINLPKVQQVLKDKNIDFDTITKVIAALKDTISTKKK